jgi:hypothetical protein
MGNEQKNRSPVLSHPNGEFSGTMVNGQFILDKVSKERLERENVRRCKIKGIAGVLGEGRTPALINKARA